MSLPTCGRVVDPTRPTAAEFSHRERGHPPRDHYGPLVTEIIVHHLERSRSHRVVWALEALGLPYSVQRYGRDPKTMRADPALKKVHPLGKSPVVTIDGTTFAESGAILEELADRAAAAGKPSLRPEPGTEEHRRFRYFLHYAEGSLMAPLLVALITRQIRVAPVPFFVKPIAKGIAAKVDEGFTSGELSAHVSFLEAELASRDHFCGAELTLADIQMSYPVEALLHRGGIDAPNLRAFRDRIHALPEHAKAMEVTGDEGLIPG